VTGAVATGVSRPKRGRTGVTLPMEPRNVANESRIRAAIADSASAIGSLLERSAGVARIADAVVGALQAGRKILTAGNGGSAAEALHFSEELVGRYRGNRRALPAMALVADSTALTCIGNDFGFDEIFGRQIEALGAPGDVLVLFSTSGAARNLTRAVQAARSRSMTVVCLLGRDGGALAGVGDHELIVRHTDTARIQECHQVLLHLVLEEVEHAYSPGGPTA
jgi:D-sedoheptulose 7-phosphate isomerase